MTPAALLAALLEIAAPVRARTIADAERLVPVLLEEAAAVSPPFDPVLLAALAWNESGFRNDRHGARGEIGTMQILPRGMALHLCRGLVISRLRDNVKCGARILARVRQICGGSPARWLSAYSGRRCGPSSYATRVLTLRRKVR
jgi:hypothetical protein